MIWLVGVAVAGTWDIARAQRSETTAPPDGATRAAYTSLVHALAAAAPSGTLPGDAEARAAALGLTLQVEGGRAWLGDGSASGAGLVALRLGPLPDELLVQAPHPYSDLHTGAVVGALFDEGGLRAACFATVPRARVDAAHAADGWLQAATDGLVDALPHPLFVQLHGFSADTTAADAVVSEGGARARHATLVRAAQRLAGALDAADIRLGADVPALAARTNAQSRLLAGRARFLHVELSLALRQGLLDDAARRARLVEALRGLARSVAW